MYILWKNWATTHALSTIVLQSLILTLEGLGEFLKVMQTFDYILGLHNCLEFSQPSSCLDEAMYICKHGKSALTIA